MSAVTSKEDEKKVEEVSPPPPPIIPLADISSYSGWSFGSTKADTGSAGNVAPLAKAAHRVTTLQSWLTVIPAAAGKPSTFFFSVNKSMRTR
jgi:hypothetical protein